MNKFLALYRVTQKCARTEEGTKVSSIIGYVILGVIVVALLGVGGYYVGIFLPVVSMLLPDVDITTSLFTLVFWMGGILILFTAVQKLLGTMFMSSDVDILAAMPLSSSQIALTRVMACVPFAYATTACFIAPFTVGYMVSAGVNAMLIALAIVGIIIIPAGVISIIAILLTLVMKIFRQVRNKDMLTVIGAIGAVILIVVINVVSNGLTNSAVSGDSATGLITSLAGISDIAWSLPFAACLGKALAGGPLYLLFAIAIVAVLAALMYVVLSHLYLPAALGMANARSSSKALDSEKLERGSASRSVDRALFLKEFKAYFKETNYIQSWIFAIVLPIILLVMGAMGAKDGAAPVGFIGAIVEASQLPVAYSIFIGVAAAISSVGLAAALSTAGTSCISREGEGFDFMKTCPVEYRVQINAKRKVAMIPLAVGGLVYQVVSFATAIIYGVVSIPMLIAALVTDVFIVVLVSNLQIRSAARKANLHWSNSQTAVKNMGLWVFLGFVMYVIFLMLAMFTVPIGTIIDLAGATIWVYIGTAALVVVVALAAFLTTKPCLRYAAEKIEALD